MMLKGFSLVSIRKKKKIVESILWAANKPKQYLRKSNLIIRTELRTEGKCLALLDLLSHCS